MTEFGKCIRIFWNYYLELESEFVETKKYVEFDEKNYSTFSVEYLKIFQAVCSEIDVVGKYLAFSIKNDFNPKRDVNIYKWWLIIQNYPFFRESIDGNGKHIPIYKFSVHNYPFGKDFIPWSNYEVEEYKTEDGKTRIKPKPGCYTPTWWLDYNSVKHRRFDSKSGTVDNYQKACLKNVCEAISALYILELAVLGVANGTIDEKESFFNNSKLFTTISFCSSKDIDYVMED